MSAYVSYVFSVLGSRVQFHFESPIYFICLAVGPLTPLSVRVSE